MVVALWHLADGKRNGAAGAGGGDTAWLLAALPSANLLPAAKFVSKGFLINQLGQVGRKQGNAVGNCRVRGVLGGESGWFGCLLGCW